MGTHLVEMAKKVDRTCAVLRKIPATFHLGSRNGDWNDDLESRYGDVNGVLSWYARLHKSADLFLSKRDIPQLTKIRRSICISRMGSTPALKNVVK